MRYWGSRVSRKMRCTFGALLAVFSLAFASLALASDLPPKTYKIGAQSVSTALKAFASQSDLQLIYTESDVGSAKTVGVTGTRAPREALAEILKGTGLQFEFTANNVVVVRKASVAAVAATDKSEPPDPAAKEGSGKKSSQDFRVAQVDQTSTRIQVTNADQASKERLKNWP